MWGAGSLAAVCSIAYPAISAYVSNYTETDKQGGLTSSWHVALTVTLVFLFRFGSRCDNWDPWSLQWARTRGVRFDILTVSCRFE